MAEYQYSRNANGAITNIAETLRLKDGTVSEKSTAYTYDSVSRLIQEEISNAKGSIQFLMVMMRHTTVFHRPFLLVERLKS